MTTPMHAVPDAPDVVTVEALHLSITKHTGGGSYNVQVHENDDLPVIVNRERQQSRNLPAALPDVGTILLCLGVNDDHDVVHYAHGPKADPVEALDRSIEALTMAREALARLRTR